MSAVALVGIDLGKHSFHLHGQDKSGREVFRKKTTRQQMMRLLGNLPSCTVVMEACAGAHFAARQLATFGHEVKLIAPQFVRPFVKGNKNDFIDAEAICEAASRPTMRFVTPKTEAQQTLSVLHRIRESLVRDRTKTVNQVHGFLLEFGISLPKGLSLVRHLSNTLAEHELPPRLCLLLMRLHSHFCYLEQQLGELDKEMASELAEDDLGSRLLGVPGVGPITASLLSAELGDGKQYGCSRDFAASLGLVPRQYSTGGRNTLLGISKRGDKNLRRLLVQCARSYLQRVDRHQGALADWVRSLRERRHSNVVACALANKLARIVWAMAVNHSEFEARPSACAA
ncbi:IS110 family transposase [Pseudomonas aeruginosa]|uniref:IS110 family transposase n=1 Tax=Pseudomonas aeruginosa TaxID=287 RepID=UPI0018C603CA|nr:IS110 family transposase [Pseudomonas aeruginosa]EKU2242372.1 IS110 family transposase [Pseudomonas aeruginosa]ELS4619339.1 IS110 family transposase [Pseudomonas aeruginosa]MBG4399168.1 IS110 family transposase [Pseudomonas aeruginosa]MCV3776316.1 IS110 family transposase [Pseudomonas aeruginosa]MDP5461113.1 IS110 family transposase [Pseudomonas aeruginosa]